MSANTGKNKTRSSFKQKFSLQQRKFEASRIHKKYPDKIPVIVDKDPNSQAPDILKTKYLVPTDMTFGAFLYVIRDHIKIKAEEALFLFVNNKLPCMQEMISTLYYSEKDEDGFLYINYSLENTFGALGVSSGILSASVGHFRLGIGRSGFC